MGLGLIAGPVIGGLAGQWSPHAPFAVAAALNALNCLMAWRFLPESRPASDATTSAATAPAAAGIRAARALQALNPLGALRWVRGLPAVPALLLAYVLAQISGQVPGSLWVLYGEDRYHWDAAMVGLFPGGLRRAACAGAGPAARPRHPAFRRARQRHAGLAGRWLRLRADRLRDAGLDGVSNPVAAGAGRPGRTRVAGAALAAGRRVAPGAVAGSLASWRA